MARKSQTKKELELKSRYRWSGLREEAAALHAEGRLSEREIADSIQVDLKTFKNWKHSAEFKARVSQIMEEMKEEVMSRGVTVKFHRLQALQDLWAKLHVIMEERGKHSSMDGVPGGRTGLINRRVKFNRDGALEWEYELDSALISELRSIQQQVAKELGDWVNITQVNIKDDSVTEQLIHKLNSLAERNREEGVHIHLNTQRAENALVHVGVMGQAGSTSTNGELEVLVDQRGQRSREDEIGSGMGQEFGREGHTSSNSTDSEESG